MIGLLIRLYFAIAIHNACNIGKPVDYYPWMAQPEHQEYRVAWSMESRVFGDYWLMQFDKRYFLFKFKQPIVDTIASGASHGECFREVQ